MAGFHRPARVYAPTVPEQKITLPAPPTKVPDQQSANLMYILMPLLSSVSMAAFMISVGRWWMIVLGICFVVLSVGVTFTIRTQFRRQARRNGRRQRDRYLEYLQKLDEQARDAAWAQRTSAVFTYPGPTRLWALTLGRRRVWERRPDDEDFLRLRVGTGSAPPRLRLEAPAQGDPTADADAVAESAGQVLIDIHARVPRMPTCVDLGRVGVLSVVDPRREQGSESGTTVLAALVMQLAVLHAPDDVRLVAVLADRQSPLRWLKWLPHSHHTDLVPAEPVVSDRWTGVADVVEAWLERVRKRRGDTGHRLTASTRSAPPPERLVVILDGYRPGPAEDTVLDHLLAEAGPASGLHVVCTVGRQRDEPERVDLRVRLTERGGMIVEQRGPAPTGASGDAVLDVCPPVLCEQVARTLSPLELSADADEILVRSIALPSMLGVGDLAAFDPASLWREADDETLLRLPIGRNGAGDPLVLDFKESAQGGVGPHGLVVGATGSGKSELLRTLVTGLTMTHSPEQLGFVLVDFKGGATFAGVTELPHVAGLITNLADDLALVDRMRAALVGEQQRRQRMLRDAGNVDSVREYQIRRAHGMTDVHGQPLEPLPYLMVIVDEFGELLSQRPDFIDLFVQIGRVGRSLGIHLLLATQRLEEGRLRGLDSHLSYRICLRTFSAAESRTVIGTTDAYRLPAIPGSAYLKVDESFYERFRVAWVSGRYQRPDPLPVAAPSRTLPPSAFGLRGEADRLRELEPHRGPVGIGVAAGGAPEAGSTIDDRPVPHPLPTASDRVAPAPGDATEMAVAVERVMTRGSEVHQIWLPPLPPAIELDALLAPLRTSEERGHHSGMWPEGGGLSFPVGVVDLPAQQVQVALMVELGGRHGHLAVVGAPQSGRSTLLRSALLAAMATHTPAELRVLGVDYGGGTLAGLEDAPHVSGIGTRHDPARSRRALAVALQLLERRERLFGRLRIDTAAEFRRRRDARELPPGTDAADLVLVIDNWAAVRGEIEDAEEIVGHLAARGLGVGAHVLLTANRWAEIRPALRDNLTGRFELRLNEPTESELSRPMARQLREAVPGRGVCAPGVLFHVALPRLDGRGETGGLAAAQQSAVRALAAGWTGEPAPELLVLPELITLPDLEKELPADADETAPHAVPVGLREFDLAPALLDLRASGHLLVFGDSGSGKTDFLRSWMRGVARRRSAWQARFVVVDYRRSLLDVVGDDHIAGVAPDPDTAAEYMRQLAEKLTERLPPADVSRAALRERSWWDGPELYVVVDDYDLVAGASGAGAHPLEPLLRFLPQAGDVGLHLVVARRVGGVSRTLMTDPVVTRLRDLGCGGLILSGDPREGVVLGDQRAQARPPGRGVLVSRQAGTHLVQLVHDPVDP